MNLNKGIKTEPIEKNVLSQSLYHCHYSIHFLFIYPLFAMALMLPFIMEKCNWLWPYMSQILNGHGINSDSLKNIQIYFISLGNRILD
ncbi:hypothetical protein KUTeg_009621 [Tegillarca granosa]|uniref:Uncharacterized protein n=1 Tax=Tegillarca granosa TaxID=220873 RepID=A0ABQ9F4E6_TEGGR|nr:hypothetical protein KUTeg_009621 [Tegillarca granosa]